MFGSASAETSEAARWPPHSAVTAAGCPFAAAKSVSQPLPPSDHAVVLPPVGIVTPPTAITEGRFAGQVWWMPPLKPLSPVDTVIGATPLWFRAARSAALVFVTSVV